MLVAEYCCCKNSSIINYNMQQNTWSIDRMKRCFIGSAVYTAVHMYYSIRPYSCSLISTSCTRQQMSIYVFTRGTYSVSLFCFTNHVIGEIGEYAGGPTQDKEE